MSGQRFYEEHEAEELLRRALHLSNEGAIDRERLVAMAAEMGISEDALAHAEKEMAAQAGARARAESEEQDRRDYRRWRRGRFGQEVGTLISVSLITSVIWYLAGAGYYWPGWLVGIMAAVTLGHFFTEVLAFSEQDYLLWKRRRDRRASRERNREDPKT